MKRHSRYAQWGKRWVDVVASIGAFVAFSPLLLIIAVLIWIFDPGPVIFRQERIGRGGRPFAFYKFRSMPVGTRNLPSSQIGEVRLTWIGRLLRRSNLDELPQLYNVLRGDMSLVGPRPPIPSQTELIEMRRANGALSIRPGLTGLAQVNSYSGMPVEEKARLDGLYAGEVTLLSDAKIIVRTFTYLMKPPPVY